ncbi:MAG: hypothetical protein IAE86_01705 [Burkholderiaceae bacterium]|nr:hypothetical protein [Burkholderiaceae bacterium]
MRNVVRLPIAATGLVALFMQLPTTVLAQESTVSACSILDAPAGCNDRMWALRVTLTAPNGAYVHVPDPGCMNDASNEVAKIIQAAVAAAQPQLTLFSGPISKLIATPIAEQLKSQGGDIGRLFSPYARNGALCVPLVAVVPVAAEVVGFRLLATDGPNGNVMKRCAPAAECPIGWSKFQATPVEAKGAAIRTYSTIFMNWSHDRSRQAQMIIFYKLPAGEKPLTEI